MHTEKKRNLNAKVRAIAKSVTPYAGESLGEFLMATAKGVTFFVSGEAKSRYFDLVSELRDYSDWSNKFSSGFMCRLVNEAVAYALLDLEDGGDRLEKGDWLARAESYAIKNTVYLKVEGLILPDGPQKMGRVEFFDVTEEIQGEILDNVASSARKSESTADNQLSFVQRIGKRFEENFLGNVIAKFSATADPEHLVYLGQIETRRALDVLRFSIPLLYSDPDKVKVGLAGEVNRGLSLAMVSSPYHTLMHSSVRGRLVPFEFSEANKKKMVAIGAYRISNLLERENQKFTDFEHAILNAVHWIADAQMQIEHENKFLNYVTAMESLLKPESYSGIAQTVSEGTALLIGENLDERKKIKKDVRNLYTKRSRVSHGDREAVSLGELYRMRDITYKLLLTLINRLDEFAKPSDLRNWLEDRKLS